MADTTFVDSSTVTAADWFNDVNRLHYTIFGDPADAAAVRTVIGAGDITFATNAQIFLDDSITAAGANLPLAFDGDPNTGWFRAGADILCEAAGGTEARRVTAAGFTKITSSGSYAGITDAYHEILSDDSASDPIIIFTHTDASNPYGFHIVFSGGTLDDNTHYFARFLDATTTRCYIYSDGDLQNHDNAYGAISDGKFKQDVVTASSQWNDVKQLAATMKKYRFKSDVAAGKDHVQLGLVAQDVLPISPGLVTVHKDDDGSDFYGLQYSILYLKGFKALGEVIERVEALEAKVP